MPATGGGWRSSATAAAAITPAPSAGAAARDLQLHNGGARSPRCFTEGCDCAFARDFAPPFPTDRVRLTSIYSKGDGVVRWQAAVTADADCVEVTGSHVGLIFNRKAYRALAAALAAPEAASEPAARATETQTT